MGADDRKYMGQNEGHLGSRGCWGNWSRPHLHALLRNDLSQRPPPTGGPSSCRPLSGVLRFSFSDSAPALPQSSVSEPWGNLFQGQREIRSVSVLGFASFHFLFLATTPGAGGGAEGARHPGWPLRTPPGGEKLKSSGHLSPVPAHLGFSRCFLVCTGSATGRGWGWKGKVLLARVAQLARPWLSTSLPASGFWTWGSALCSISWKLGPLQGAADRGRPQCGWEILALRPRKGNAGSSNMV